MSFLVLVAPSAVKDLNDLPGEVRSRVLSAVKSLGNDPLPSGSKKLEGSAHNWRLRIRDYRVLYTLNPADKSIRVYRVKHRREAYR